MPAKRDEPSAPPQAENDKQRRSDVGPKGPTGWFVPARGRGMNHPYETARPLMILPYDVNM